MGIWPFSSSSSSGPGPTAQKASDGGLVAPDRSSRKQCYIGRDAFFNCLDDNGILDAIKDEADAKKKCGKELQEFETACSQTWVKYFKEKRVMEYNRDQTIDKIKREDAEQVAKQKTSGSTDKKSGGIF